MAFSLEIFDRYERINPVLNGTVFQTGNVYRNPGAPVHVVQVVVFDQSIGFICKHLNQGTAGVFQDFQFTQPQPGLLCLCMYMELVFSAESLVPLVTWSTSKLIDYSSALFVCRLERCPHGQVGLWTLARVQCHAHLL